ncbi:MAG: hypothetical protein OCD02_17300 [Spirochaetaceae bacterium]
MKFLISTVLLFLSVSIYSLPFTKIIFKEEYQICSTLDGPLFFSNEQSFPFDFHPEKKETPITFLSENKFSQVFKRDSIGNSISPTFKGNSDETEDIGESTLKGNYTTNYNLDDEIESKKSFGFYSFEIEFEISLDIYYQKYIIMMNHDES